MALYRQWMIHQMKENGQNYLEKPVTWGDFGRFLKWAELSYHESAKQAEREFEDDPLGFLQKTFGSHEVK